MNHFLCQDATLFLILHTDNNTMMARHAIKLKNGKVIHTNHRMWI